MSSSNAHDDPAVERANNVGAYVAVALIGIAGIALSSAKAIIIGVYIHDFGMTPSVAGYLLSVQMVAATAGVIVSTMVGGRVILAAALAAILVGDLGTAASSMAPFLFAFQIVGGLGHGIALGRLGQGVAATANPQRATGLFTVSYLTLSSLNAYLLPATKGLLGPHALFVTFAITAPLALLGLRWFPAVDPRRAHKVAGGTRTGPVLTAFVMLAFLVWYLGIGGFWPFVGQFGEHAGIPFDERTKILGSANLFGLAGASISLILGGRFGSFKPLVTFVSLQVTAVLILMLGAGNGTAFMIGSWLYVFAWLGGFPNQLGTLSRIDPTGRLNALTYVMGNIAYAVGPAGVGLMLRSAGSQAAGLERLQYGGLGLLLVSGTMILSLAIRADGIRRAQAHAKRLQEAAA